MKDVLTLCCARQASGVPRCITANSQHTLPLKVVSPLHFSLCKVSQEEKPIHVSYFERFPR
jgi:hypothetical protein